MANAHLIVSAEDDLRHSAVALPLAVFRLDSKGPLIVANGFTRESAMRAVSEGAVDALAFGRLFIANPDLPDRFRLQAPPNTPHEATFYGGAEKGYTDYPALARVRQPYATIQR